MALLGSPRSMSVWVFVGGAKSDYVRLEDFPEIHRLFPRADIKFIPDSGHWPHADKPKEFSQTVIDFLDECLQGHEGQQLDDNWDIPYIYIVSSILQHKHQKGL